MAIKLLSASLQAERMARFRREGQLLGRLAHPNIARLLDAGALPAGTPFLVLEHIDGLRIEQWCDAQRLTIARRLQLFIQVCAALSHAHALVHEAWLGLAGSLPRHLASRRVFFGYAARAMDHVLIDQLCQRQAHKRGGGQIEVTLATGMDFAAERYDEDRFDALHAALQRLQRIDTELHELVRLRAFAGLSIEEAAQLLALSGPACHAA